MVHVRVHDEDRVHSYGLRFLELPDMFLTTTLATSEYNVSIAQPHPATTGHATRLKLPSNCSLFGCACWLVRSLITSAVNLCGWATEECCVLNRSQGRTFASRMMLMRTGQPNDLSSCYTHRTFCGTCFAERHPSSRQFASSHQKPKELGEQKVGD